MAVNECPDPDSKFSMCNCCKRTMRIIRKLSDGTRVEICSRCDLNEPFKAPVKKNG